MKRIFFETSAVNRAVVDGADAAALLRRLSGSGATPVIGIHVIYELAASYLRPEQAAIGRALFRFVRDLDPSITPPTMDLLLQEVLRLRTNAAVLPFLPYENQAAARLEIHRLADGIFDAEAQRFIDARENEVRREHPRMANAYIEHVRRVRRRRGDSLPALRCFGDVAEYFRDWWPEMIRTILHNTITLSEALELAARLTEFQAIRSVLNANLYLTFICIAHESVPGDDKLDDYRHLAPIRK